VNIKLYKLAGVLSAVLVLVGCLSGAYTSGDVFNGDAYSDTESWVLMPLINESDSLTAEQSATSLVEEHLRQRGVNTLLSTSELAKTSSAQHLVTGRIVDWKYENLTRPKPNVKIALHVYDMNTQELLWRQEQSKTGGAGDSIVQLADEVLAGLVSRIDVSNQEVARNGTDDQAVSAAVGALASQVEASSPVFAAAQSSDSSASGFLETGSALPTTKQVPSQYAPGGSIALYYAVNPPVDILNEFDRVVLEADAVTPAQLAEFNQDEDTISTLFAYLSVGEVGPTRTWRSSVDKSWVLGVNGNWASEVMDLSNPGWRAFLMRRADELIRQGYQGFFLDTMDSFHIIAKTDAEKQRQQEGLITFIASLKAKHPGVQLIANRGFEVLPSIASHLDVIAAESLYARWHGTGGYQAVPENDRTWLLGQLNNARQRYGLEALSIDYVEPSNREKARQVAEQIADHGIIPWVSTPGLDQVGVGLEEVFPREVMLLFDSKIDGEVEFSFVHRMVATPLEYMGYVPRYLDLAKEELPKGNLSGQYAGIVSWTDNNYPLTNWSSWLMDQKKSGVPLVLLGNVGAGASASVFSELGLRQLKFKAGNIKPKVSTSIVGYERQPVPRLEFLATPLKSNAPGHKVHLSLVDEAGTEIDAVAVTPWGGYGVTQGLIDIDFDNSVYWIVNPFVYLKDSLQLANIPQPDVTTQTGRRITLAHIDGDALPSWAEMPGKKLGAEILYEEILERYNLPHTVSIVEAEMTDTRYFDRRKRMYDVMRNIFKEDYVQLATHTYSHPFKWKLIKPGAESGRYNLRVPNYEFSFEREIGGSVDFINQNLAPPGKKVEVVLWSGDALPTEEALAEVERRGLYNVNGGNTSITYANNNLPRVSPMMRPSGKYEQIYAPVINENVYTNDWTGPFDGFRKVIETLELTESPKRLKPINIYYHFYSGTKTSAMRAMKEVYDWTEKQDIAPMFLDSYAMRVGEFRKAQVSRSLDGWWTVSGLEETQSIRWLGDVNQIDIGSSSGVAGQRKLHDGLYIHPASNGVAKFRQGDGLPNVPELVSSNGQISSWVRNGRSLSFRIEADVPVEIVLKNTLGCRLRGASSLTASRNTEAGQHFTFTQKDTGNVSLECPA